MPSDYDQIRHRNIKRYGEDEDYHSLLVDDLYSDRTHFIYEILQNAEDAGASKVRFVVSQDKLEVMHDGSPFTTQDVKGVCGIGKGQKAADLTKIGRFGIGFKSVYAYTTSPEIHSGDEHFRIKKYVRPYRATARRVGDSCTTLFVFPFDKDRPDQKTAFREIHNRLRNLNARTLLFLKKIEEIEYRSQDTTGVYLRRESTYGHGARKVGLVGQTDEEETWIVFERPVSGAGMTCSVELAFRLTNSETRTIEREHDAPLVAYFPTEKHTRLGYYIQGPYRTTLARDNVPEGDPVNIRLIEETAKLTVDSLRQLKKMGMLTISLLEALPIIADDFSPDSMFMFRPIFTYVRDAFVSENLLPVKDGTFVAARNAMLARGEDLMKLLDGRQLSRLLESDDDVQWLSPGITDDRTHDLRQYLIHDLGVREITPEVVAEKLTECFISAQPDEWISDFYCYLSNHPALWRSGKESRSEGVLRGKAILRLRDGSHVAPFGGDDEPNAYLLSKDDAEMQLKHVAEAESLDAGWSVPIVRVEVIHRHDALRFLEDLGIPRFDVVEDVLRHVLPKYDENEIDIGPDENQRDVALIERAYNTDSDAKRKRLRARLSTTRFIWCTVPATGTQEYRTADSVYFQTDELCRYFDGDKSFAYIESDQSQRAMFKELGVEEKVRIWGMREPNQNGYINFPGSHGHHSRGRDEFNRDICVDGLENALSEPTIEKSAFIWRVIAIPLRRCIRGVVESSTRQNYPSDYTTEDNIVSSFGKLLRGRRWLPDGRGVMHEPGAISVNDLHKSFARVDPEVHELEVRLGMMADIEPDLLAKARVSPQELDVARRFGSAPPETRRQILGLLNAQECRQPEFPTGGTVENPGRRRDRVRQEYDDAPEKSYERQSRVVRTTRGAIDSDTQLRQWYTNDETEMICQICGGKMSFKKDDGEYYFESVEVLSRDYLPREHASQYLALCPLCAAKYKYFVKRDDDKEAMDGLRRALIDTDRLDSDVLEVPLGFGGESATLRLVSRHVIDLKTILEWVSDR